MEDDPAKFLLAGHRGGGKTTELRRLEQHLNSNYTVIWIDTVTALDQYNIGYAEVVVLIGIKIFEKVIQREWGLKDDLLNDLLESLKTVVYQDEDAENTGLELPEIIKKLGLILKQGLTRKVTTTLNIRPQLSKIIERVNAIIEAAEKRNKQKLLVIVDGLDRHDQVTALVESMAGSRVRFERHRSPLP
ncbi:MULTISPECIES: P-loop NTPase fold protein [unclassified Nostoc]|uniref:P-loop NTPase fold protein n=1 Tax=unclassified Nostoc TaxID=2593658 RepID=UPI001CB96E0F|nr:P-loop NTPase fold protein [Nostoc sp. 'Peltigera membranacea cyanobiont' 232]